MRRHSQPFRQRGDGSRWWLVPCLAAVLMGLPTLRGGFVGGDDHRLALNHVLVNRPSLAHAVELFQITHRDLYQPVPLLSFSFDFLVVRALGLAERGPQAFAWYFHLVNILLHAVNTCLVGLTVRMLLRPSPRSCDEEAIPNGGGESLDSPLRRSAASSRGENFIPAIAAMIFAVHPFQAEVVAWTNGRMMLLSTLFGLLTLLSFSRWMDNRQSALSRGIPSLLGGVGVALLALLCAVSKIRIELPVLMMIIIWARRARIDVRTVALLAICAAITAIFVVVNVKATAEAELFSGGAEQLRGPRLVRVLLALSFYFSHLAWPVGLASYYPTPPYVSWSDADTWRAALVVVPTMVLMTWLALRRRDWRLGLLWFFAAIAAVLPFFPARNVLAADRYMYLPIIGLLWPVSTAMARLWNERIHDRSSGARRGTLAVAAVLVIASIAQCWNTARYYSDPVLKTYRVAQLFPDVPRVWERLGWTYYEAGRYAEAEEAAKKELRHDAPPVRSGALQLLGMAALKTGRGDEALRLLHEALEVDEKSSLGKLRLAMAFDELGRPDDALPWYESAAADAPAHNPTLQRLASVYRSLGRTDEARRLYLKQIENNPYEVPAILALAELDIEQSTPESLDAAEGRLRALLEWMPENPAAHVSLGLVMAARNRPSDAIAAYEQALRYDPREMTALLNLANLQRARGDSERAGHFFDLATAQGGLTMAQAESVHDYYASRGAWDRCAALWTDVAKRPGSGDATIYRIWSAAMAGVAPPPGASQAGSPGSATDAAIAWCGPIRIHHPGAATTSGASGVSPVDDAARAWCALAMNDIPAARRSTARLAGPDVSTALRSRLLAGLERFDELWPENPWTFCMAAALLRANGNMDGARAFVGLCERFCRDDACKTEAARLGRTMSAP